MLYSNVLLVPKMRYGKYGVFFKTCNNDSQGIFLPVNKEILYNIEGTKLNLNIELVYGVPRIATKMCQDLYMILATEHDTRSPNHGIFAYLKSQNVEFVGRKYFLKQGREQFYIIKAKDGNVFRIVWGDDGRDPTITYYLVDGGKVYTITEREGVEKLYQEHNMTMPFHFQICRGNRIRLNHDEWCWL